MYLLASKSASAHQTGGAGSKLENLIDVIADILATNYFKFGRKQYEKAKNVQKAVENDHKSNIIIFYLNFFVHPKAIHHLLAVLDLLADLIVSFPTLAMCRPAKTFKNGFTKNVRN